MPYILLGVAGVCVLAYAVSRVPTRPLMAALIAMGASLGVSDLVVCGLLRLYTFRPHLFVELRQDNGIGVLLADFVFVPFAFASLVMLLPRARTLTTVAFVVLLTGIEILFFRLGIFVHHAWSFWYTFLLFAARCGLAVWWLNIFEQRGYTGVFPWLIVGSGLTYGWFLWQVISGAILRLWNMRMGVLDPFRDQVLSNFLLHGLPFILLGVACVMIRGVSKPIRLAALVGTMWLYLTGLEAAGLWRDRTPWSPLASAVASGVLVYAVLYLDEWMTAATRRRIAISQR